MARVTKYDLERQVSQLEQENTALRARINTLEIEPGVFSGGHYGRERYAARPVPRDSELREWLREAAVRLVCEGDFETAEGVEHVKLQLPLNNDDLPPGTDAIIIQYSYSDNWGCNVSAFWPAVKINGEA